MEPLTLTLDGQKRISLARLLKGIQSKTFDAFVNEKGNIELTPVMKIPEREFWLHKDKKALTRVERGIQQALEGKVVEMEL